MRATIVVDADQPAQIEVVEAWFAKWGAALRHRSDDTGCGCCVHIWDVDGPEEALAELPPDVQGESPWTRVHAS